MRLNKSISILVVLALLFVTVPIFVSAQAQSSKQTTLTFVTGDWVPPVLKPYFKKYEKKTGIKIKTEAYPYSDLLETIQIRAKSESKKVDVVLVDAPLTANYAVNGYIKSLDPYFTEEEVDNTWAETSAKEGYYNGEFYSAPLNNSTQVLYYNKDLLKKAGVEFPPADVEKRWTWSEVVEAAKKVDNLGKDIWGLCFGQVDRYYQLQALPMSLGGGSGVVEDGLKAEVTTDPWIEAFSWYRKLFNEWKIAPKGVGPGQMPDMFTAGEIGFLVQGLWDMQTFLDADVNYAVAPHPYFKGEEPVTPTNSWHVGIWNWTQHEKAAAKFLRWLTTNTEIGIHYLEDYGQFPARKVALKHIAKKEEYGKQPLIAYRLGKYEVSHTAVTRAKTPAFHEFERNINAAFKDIRNGADPKKALRRAERKINQLFRRYR